MNKQRLNMVAKAVRECEHPELFTLYQYGTDEGIPTCPLGLYASRTDLQKLLFLNETGNLCTTGEKWEIEWDDEKISDHFGLSEAQVEILFGREGCGQADTPEQAAAFIEGFIALYR
jgi:hypothetical protein